MRLVTLRSLRSIGALLALLMLPSPARAQEATLRGTVTDGTGATLPGVSVRAVQTTSGNSFESVTDDRGSYRLPVRVGPYQLTAELAGFSPIARTVTLLVGQEAVVNLQMVLSAVQESVTVSGEAPLLDVTQSSVGGSIDPHQVEALPINGRNWTELVLLAPGARANSVDTAANAGPSNNGGSQGRSDYQINLDGQQVTQEISYTAGAGPPRFSRDAIAEFELLSSRYDATQGRSVGLQVNAITKSGSNTPSGTMSGYFRNSNWGTQPDFVANKVLPFSDQQVSGTFGGPIRKDRVHFFGHYEYERNPNSVAYTTPYPHFNQTLTDNRIEKIGGGRLDTQFSPQTRLSVRVSMYRMYLPLNTSGIATSTSTPSSATGQNRSQAQSLATLTQVFNNRLVNEVRVGMADLQAANTARFKNALAPRGWGGPSITLSGFSVGGGALSATSTQNVGSVRDDLTYAFTKGGHHTIKLGAEVLNYHNLADGFGAGDNGTLDARGGPIPTNIESLFPNLYDAATWNLAPLSSIAVSWKQSFGNWRAEIPKQAYAGWLQDDWAISSRLTLNLGVRYDLENNAFANEVEMAPFMPANRPNDTNNIGPRTGFSLSLNNSTVIRGGFGVYYGSVNNGYYTLLPTQTVTVTKLNDGRADFASNPFNGPVPSYESLAAKLCTPALIAGCTRNSQSFGTYNPYSANPYSYQSAIGIEHQLTATTAFQADYVYTGVRDNIASNDDKEINLTYNPATGANYPFSNISTRPYPWMDFVLWRDSTARSNYHGLQTAFTKRMSHGWQTSATYTLAGLWDAFGRPRTGTEFVPFATQPDLGGEYTLSQTDQRHRAVVNAIGQLPFGLQLSGVYFFGSGLRYPTSWGTDVRGTGGASQEGEKRLRPDGTIVPRNNFVGQPIHRVDMRLEKKLRIAGHAGIDGIFEVFNAFNHANYASYVTTEVSKNYGSPQASSLVEYAPRMIQLGFRLTF